MSDPQRLVTRARVFGRLRRFAGTQIHFFDQKPDGARGWQVKNWIYGFEFAAVASLLSIHEESELTRKNSSMASRHTGPIGSNLDKAPKTGRSRTGVSATSCSEAAPRRRKFGTPQEANLDTHHTRVRAFPTSLCGFRSRNRARFSPQRDASESSDVEGAPKRTLLRLKDM